MDREKIKNFYAHKGEANRLETELFKLEGIRTKQIIERYTQKANLEILDVGGGTGYYSFWLQEKGHTVTLVDLSPVNIDWAKTYSRTTGKLISRLEVGEAVNLNFPDRQFDMVLLLGPLYHLIEKAERIKALSEAKRVLKPKGILLAAIISRYASLIDGFQRDLIRDDRFFNLLINDLKTGVHLNETDNLEYFTTAYFHTQEEISAEIGESGLSFEQVIPVESFGWVVRNFSEKEKDADYMGKLLAVIGMLEGNKDLVALSPHSIAVARKE